MGGIGDLIASGEIGDLIASGGIGDIGAIFGSICEGKLVRENRHWTHSIKTVVVNKLASPWDPRVELRWEAKVSLSASSLSISFVSTGESPLKKKFVQKHKPLKNSYNVSKCLCEQMFHCGFLGAHIKFIISHTWFFRRLC